MQKQEQIQERSARFRSDLRESGSGSGGGKGLECDSTARSSRMTSFEFNAHLTSMYSSSSSCDESSDVDAFVMGWLPGCSVREMSDFMRITGKKSRNKTHLHLKRNLPAIASRIEKLSTASWRSRGISAVVYGLQCLLEDDDGYLAVVAAMTAAFVKSTQSGDAVPFQSISMAMIGLQKNKLRARQSVELLKSIMIITKNCRETPNAQAVGNALYGMQGMSSDHAEVRSMVSALLGKVHSCKESLGAQEVGNALYGMQCMSSDHAEVRSMVSALAGKVHSCKESLGAQAVGNALYGMQGMSSDHAEVRSMVSALLGKVHSCKESLSAQEVGNALYGMQGMSNDHCASILAFLLGHISSLTEAKHLKRLDLLSIGQAVHLCIPSRRDVLDDASYKLWTEFGDLVCSEHRHRRTIGECEDSFRSHVERKVHRVAASLYGQSRVTVSSNDYLFDMFEGDVVVRIPFVGETDGIEKIPGSREYFVINIEVDGMHHRQERKINFCKMRDAYLKSRGVIVHRIDASLVTKMNDNQLEQWLLDVTAESLLMSGVA